MENSLDSKPKQDIIEFLCGSGSYDGLWFGGKPPTDRRSPFWWRRNLREYVDAIKEERDLLKAEVERLKNILK